jgi:hypothetical protein
MCGYSIPVLFEQFLRKADPDLHMTIFDVFTDNRRLPAIEESHNYDAFVITGRLVWVLGL